MALMKFREANQVQWRGVRPGHDGTMFSGGAVISGNDNAVVYTVPAASTAYLTYISMSVKDTGAVAGGAALSIYTAVPGLWRIIMNHLVHTEGDWYNTETFFYPIEIPATYTVRIVTTAVGIAAYGIVWGWYEAD